MKRQQRMIGAVLRVPLENDMHTYAVTLPEADFAFFDARSSAPIADLGALLDLPILFTVAVHKSAWSQGRWLKMGKIAPPQNLLAPRPMFIQKIIGFQIYLGGTITASTREECEGLDRCEVWEPHHVEDRLNAHYKGVPCKWEISQRIR